MILCQCLVDHREHEFRPGGWGMCTVCGHGVGAHKPEVDEVTDRIRRLLHVYQVADWRISSEGDEVHLEMTLARPA